MKATYQLNRTDQIEATMTITMTVSEWKDLAAQQKDREWPSWRFAGAIQDMIRKAEEKFWTTGEAS